MSEEAGSQSVSDRHRDKEILPDTAKNVAVFGCHHFDWGQAALPSVESVYLAECGTHAIPALSGYGKVHRLVTKSLLSFLNRSA